MRRTIPTLALALTLPFAACSPRSTTPGGDSNAECSTRLPAFEYSPEAPAALVSVASHITVDLRAEVAALERELSKQVPVTLAAESGRPIGAPGEVSYVVRRGPIALGLNGDRLSVSVPVQIDVEVCKPLGPFCPVYGRCNPSLSAIASVPVLLGENYEIGKSKVGMAMGRSCVIAGIDAGPEIKTQAARQVGAVQARIDHSMPDIRPSVASVWELLHHPVSLDTSTCLRIKPNKLAQAKPALASGVLEQSISATGDISVEEPCEDRNAPVHAAPLPRLETLDRLPQGVDLEIPLKMEWKNVSSALTRSLESNDRELRIVKVEARGARDKVALRVTLAGKSCGDVWLLAEPWYDADSSRLRLKNLALAPGAPSIDVASALFQRIESGAKIPLPVDVSSGPNALDGLVQSFTKDLAQGVTMETKMAPPKVDRVLVAAENLVPIATLAGTATLHVK